MRTNAQELALSIIDDLDNYPRPAQAMFASFMKTGEYKKIIEYEDVVRRAVRISDKSKQFPEDAQSLIKTYMDDGKYESVLPLEDDFKEEIIGLRLQKAALLIKNAGDFPDDVQRQIDTAYEDKDYCRMQEIAAKFDVQGREWLGSKITTVSNPHFVPSITEADAENFFNSISKEQLDNLIKEAQESINTDGQTAVHENVAKRAEEEQKFVFVAEGIDKLFRTASEASCAYREEHNLDKRGRPTKENAKDRKSGHSFRPKPKFIISEDLGDVDDQTVRDIIKSSNESS